MKLTVKPFTTHAQCTIETDVEEIRNLREKWSREAAKLLAKEIIGNGLLETFEGFHPSRDERQFSFFLKLGTKETRLP